MINSFYLSDVEKIRDSFHQKKDFSHVLLFDFFEAKEFLSLQRELKKCTLRYEKKPMLHSYSSSSLHLSLQKKIFSPEMLGFLRVVVDKKISLKNLKLYSFFSGDYTLLNDSRTEKEGLDIIFDFTERWDSLWGGVVT